MPGRDIRWRKSSKDGRTWLILDGEVTRYYTTPGYGDWPHALFERLPPLPLAPAAWTYRRLVGFYTRAELEAWIQTADLDRPGPPWAWTRPPGAPPPLTEASRG
jgi:hypothetical protein